MNITHDTPKNILSKPLSNDLLLSCNFNLIKDLKNHSKFNANENSFVYDLIYDQEMKILVMLKPTHNLIKQVNITPSKEWRRKELSRVRKPNTFSLIL